MQIYSLSFLYLFLPAAILLCLFAPHRARAAALLAVSGAFYAMLEGDNLLLAAAVIAFDYGMGLLMERSASFARLRRAIMICSVVKSLAILVLYSLAQEMTGAHSPFGLGVICLTSCGYVMDCYFGYTYCEHSLVQLGLMTLFFPKLYAGPLVYHSKIVPQTRSMRMTLEKTGEGARYFLQGLAKKVLIGDTIYRLYGTLRALPMASVTMAAAWTMVVTLAFSVYFILAGFCDMARGLALIFGFELQDNFHAPFGSIGINDFFSRFNITVNRYVRRYVYINLGGAQGSVISGVFNILLVTILMGLWFSISLNLLLWGVYFALFVIFERYCLGRRIDLIPPLLRWIYSTVVIMVSFCFLAGDTPGQSISYLLRLFGLRGTISPESGSSILYLLASNYLVLLIAVFSSTGLIERAAKVIYKHAPRLYWFGTAVLTAALLIVTTAFLV